MKREWRTKGRYSKVGVEGQGWCSKVGVEERGQVLEDWEWRIRGECSNLGVEDWEQVLEGAKGNKIDGP